MFTMNNYERGMQVYATMNKASSIAPDNTSHVLKILIIKTKNNVAC